MINLIKKIFKPGKVNEPNTIFFSNKLNGAIDRAEKIIHEILCSNLPKEDRLQITDKILCLIDDLRGLQTLKLKEERKIWEQIYTMRSPGSF